MRLIALLCVGTLANERARRIADEKLRAAEETLFQMQWDYELQYGTARTLGRSLAGSSASDSGSGSSSSGLSSSGSSASGSSASGSSSSGSSAGAGASASGSGSKSGSGSGSVSHHCGSGSGSAVAPEVIEMNQAVVTTLVCTITTAAVFFYLLHIPITIKKAWFLLQQVATIFVAVAIINAFVALIGNSGNWRGTVSTIHLIFWAAVVYMVSWKLRHKPQLAHPVAHICAHVAGFAGVQTFAYFQEEFFGESVGMSFLAFFVSAAIMGGIVHINEKCVLSRVADHHFTAHMSELEGEAISFMLSYIWTQAVMYGISDVGTFPGAHPPPPSQERITFMMLYWIFLLLVVIFLSTQFFGKYEPVKRWVTDTDLGAKLRRYCDTMLSMMVAWGMYYWGAWQFYGDGSFLAMVILCTGFTLATGGAVVLLSWWDEDDDYEWDEVVITSFGVLCGFSWEHAFGTAINLYTMTTCVESERVEQQFLLTLGVIILMVPAIVKIIYPIYHDLEHDNHEHCRECGHEFPKELHPEGHELEGKPTGARAKKREKAGVMKFQGRKQFMQKIKAVSALQAVSAATGRISFKTTPRDGGSYTASPSPPPGSGFAPAENTGNTPPLSNEGRVSGIHNMKLPDSSPGLPGTVDPVV